MHDVKRIYMYVHDMWTSETLYKLCARHFFAVTIKSDGEENVRAQCAG